MARNLAEVGGSFIVPAALGYLIAQFDAHLEPIDIGFGIGCGALGMILILPLLAASRAQSE